MESHKWQANSSQFIFKREFEGQECMDSIPSRTEASFRPFYTQDLLRRLVYNNASHNKK
jgi:hypothetical protein